MIRLFLRLFGIKDFEPCKSCETLKEQLEFARAENEELRKTLIDFFKPQIVAQTPIELQPIQPKSTLFSRRRAAMEERDRLEAATLKNSTTLAKPDSEIDKLEKELGVEQEKEA